MHFLQLLVNHKQTAPWEMPATEPEVRRVSSACRNSAATQSHCYSGCRLVWSGWHRSPPPPPQAGKLCDSQLGGPSCCLLLPKSFLGRSAACHWSPAGHSSQHHRRSKQEHAAFVSVRGPQELGQGCNLCVRPLYFLNTSLLGTR